MLQLFVLLLTLGLVFDSSAEDVKTKANASNTEFVKATQKIRFNDASQKIRKALDMKIFHDSSMVQIMANNIRTNGHKSFDGGAILTQTDTELIQNTVNDINKNQLTQEEWAQLEQQINQDPYEVFLTVIQSQTPSKLDQEKLDSINTLDKNAIKDMVQVMTSSGPAIGAGIVPVVVDQTKPIK